MILGIYGTFCVGKTTFLESLELPGIRKVFGDLVSINYDNIPEFPESKYYRTLQGKLLFIDYMVGDSDTLWIVEGVGFWRSMQHHIRPIIDRYCGGLYFVIITTTADYMRGALIKRAKVNNKPYRDDYWTWAKLEYEAERRAVNACCKHLDDNDWHQFHFAGDFSMWDSVEKLIKVFASDRSLWYYRCPTVPMERTPV